MNAAIDAAGNHPVASARSIVSPADSATSILLEHLTQLALTSADSAPGLDSFTLFAGRDGDRSRQSLSPADRAHLRGSGFDFRSALALAESAESGMTAAANGIYLRHASASASTPGRAARSLKVAPSLSACRSSARSWSE